MADYRKQRIALRYWLLGAGYHRAADAMAFAEAHHTGVRKDGVTPEFSHQVAIASHLRCLAGQLRHPEETIAVGFLHDVREDYDVADHTIRDRFGNVVADGVDAMTKTFEGVDRNPDDVFAAIAADPCASVAKATDRVHNHSTMVGVFSIDKIVSYTDETRLHFLPMIRAARRAFPDQEPVYEQVKLVLTAQLDLLDALVAAG